MANLLRSVLTKAFAYEGDDDGHYYYSLSLAGIDTSVRSSTGRQDRSYNV